MKNIPFQFSLSVPTRSDIYKLTKKEAKELLENKRNEFERYLQETESEFNDILKNLVQGSNLIENDDLLKDENIVDYGESKLGFIGEKNRNNIIKLNNLFKDIKKGINVYNTIKNNKIFNSLNKTVVLSHGVFPDILKFNEIVSEMGFEFQIEHEKLLKDINYYDEDIYLIFKTIESNVILKLVTDWFKFKNTLNI